MAIKIDLEGVFERAKAQFSNLNPSEPGQWPILPKVAAWAAASVVVVFVAWFVLVSGAMGDLEAENAKEPELKDTYNKKLAEAINLDALRKQKLEVQEYVTQLERQLPAKAEMDALLSDINQAGLGRGLQFELFRPGQALIREYYAELPISLRVSGRFHDFGAFVADIANLSRIVTLHNIVITTQTQPAVGGSGAAGLAVPSGQLTMEATARTYRYLDPSEVGMGRKAAAASAANPSPGGAKPAGAAK
jgi:type IV pilus assembly protein PilO